MSIDSTGNSSDTNKWHTRGHDIEVLAIARTLTSTTRVMDALAVFRADRRVHVTFTFDDASENAAGVADLLVAGGNGGVPRVEVIDWDKVRWSDYHLILSASENVRFGDIDPNIPILVLPHGAGFHKMVPSSNGPGEHIAGVVDESLLSTHDITLGVPHPGQAERISRQEPAVAGRTAMIGDPSLDRMLISQSRRDEYRRAMGVAGHHQLILISSTWGPESTYGRWPRLPEQLLAQLPVDEYRVALVLHPNVWAHHREFNIHQWEWDALSAGLILVNPINSWQAALIACDALIVDHGSIGHYGAALNKPVLLGPRSRETFAGTPASEFADLAPILDPPHVVRQLENLLANPATTDQAKLMREIFDQPGESFRLLRETCYRLIGAAAPDDRVRQTTVPIPRTESFTVTSHLVSAEPHDGGISIRRFPAILDPNDPAITTNGVQFLAARTDDPDPRMPSNAAVLVDPLPPTTSSAPERLDHILATHPRVAVTAIPTYDGILVAYRDGRRQLLTNPTPQTSPTPQPGPNPNPDVLLTASSAHATYLLAQNPPSC